MTWEQEVARDLRASGYPNAVTARLVNKLRDDHLVDIASAQSEEDGRMFDDIQCKFATKIEWQLLGRMEAHDKGTPKRRKVMAINLGKMEKGKRTHKGKFALMYWRDYLQMLKIVKTCEAVRESLNEAPGALLPDLLDAIKRKGHG